jgi:hypothetical protein
MFKKALTSVVSKIVERSGFVISTGAERPETHTWLSGYQSPGAQPAKPAIGISPAKLEAARANDNETVKKSFLMILSPIFLLDCDAET